MMIIMIIIVMMMTTTTMMKMMMKSGKKKQLCYISNVVKTSKYSTCLQSSSSECIQSNLIVVINMLPSIKNNKRLVINILRPILKI